MDQFTNIYQVSIHLCIYSGLFPFKTTDIKNWRKKSTSYNLINSYMNNVSFFTVYI